MSAENVQGDLLEEYIAQKIRPYGFLWRTGHTLRAIDFCNTSGSALLQVKNKNNTENSSSSKIRQGTSIVKWYRLGVTSKNSRPTAIFMWDKLNAFIDENRSEGAQLPYPNLSEEEYQKYLANVAKENPSIITDSREIY